TADSRRFNTAAPATVTLAGANPSTSGGILVTAGVGNNASAITGGSLRGASGSDLIVIQANTANTLNIGSNIVDNGTATALSKFGAGTLIVSGAANTYSGGTFVQQGTLISTGSLGRGPARTGAT